MDPMARTYGRLDGSEHDELFAGLSSMEIIDVVVRLGDRWRPANDNRNADGVDPAVWGVMRDHWSGDLREWCGQVDDLQPRRPQLVPRG